MNYNQLVLDLIRDFSGTKFEVSLNEAIAAYREGDYGKIDEVVGKLPTDRDLLGRLVEKLRGKSTYTGLRNLLEGRDQSVEQQIISVASLITHVGIEMRESKEYKKLLPDLYSKLGVLISKL